MTFGIGFKGIGGKTFYQKIAHGLVFQGVWPENGQGNGIKNTFFVCSGFHLIVFIGDERSQSKNIALVTHVQNVVLTAGSKGYSSFVYHIKTVVGFLVFGKNNTVFFFVNNGYLFRNFFKILLLQEAERRVTF